MPATQQQQSLSVGGGGAWGEPADVALLHEVAALLSPSGVGGGFASPGLLQHQQQAPSSSQLTATAFYDADEELAQINELLDAQIQHVHYQQQHQQQQQQQSLLLTPEGRPLPPVRVSVPVPSPLATDVARCDAREPTAAALAPPPSLVTKPIVAKPVPKTTRERQKEELMGLRIEAAELEAQLESHKQLHRKIVTAPAASQQHHGDRDTSSWWARVADHQLIETRKAEEENNRLRDMALGQLRLAKSLEKVLEKRRMWEDADQPHKRPRPQSLPDQDSNPNSTSEADASIFASLKSVLASRDCGGDTVSALFKQHGLDIIAEDTVDVDIKNNSSNSNTSEPMHVDLKVVKLLPFNYRAVSDATWQCIQNDLLDQKQFGVGGVYEKSEHLVAIKLVVAPKPSVPPLTTRSVFQRYVEPDRVVLQYETLTESSAAKVTSNQQNSAFPAIRYREQGWLTIAPIDVPSASVASVTRQFTRITPVANSALATTESHANGRGVLMDLLIALQLQSVHKAHEAIQDTLIDAQVAAAAKVQPPSLHSNPDATTTSSLGVTRGEQSS